MIIPLDTGPLGILTNPKPSLLTLQAIQWSIDCLAAGHRFVVPAIADLELRRELQRMNNKQSLANLDAFNAAAPDRYLPLNDAALKQAATLWAQARSIGNLPGDPKELNGDVIIAAQILDYQISNAIPIQEIIVATVNVGHLALFVPAEKWTNIAP